MVLIFCSASAECQIAHTPCGRKWCPMPSFRGKLVRAKEPQPQLANAGQMIHRLHCIYHKLQTNWISPASCDTLQIKRCCQLADKCKSSNKLPSLSDPLWPPVAISFSHRSKRSLSRRATPFPFALRERRSHARLVIFPAIRVSVTIAFAFAFRFYAVCRCEKRKEYQEFAR